MQWFMNRSILYAPPTEGGGVTVEAGTGGEVTPASEPGVPAGFTPSEWSNLLPAEREAFGITDEQIEEAEKEELTEEDIDGALEETGEVSDETKTPEELAAEKTEADRVAALSAEDKEKEEAAKAAPAEGLPSDEDLLSFRAVVNDSEIPLPQVEIKIPDALQAKIDALNTRQDEVNTWFDEGEKPDKTEFTKADLRKAMKEIDNETATINQEIAELRIEARLKERDLQKENLVWRREQKAFTAATPEYREFEADGVTITEKSKMLWSAFSTKVNSLLADPANEGKSGMQLLIEADRSVRKAFGMAPRGQKAAAVPAKGKQPVTPKVPAAKVPDSMVNLSEVPAAGEHESDPFAHIDRIKDPVLKEQALAAMTPQQEAAYLRSARG